MHHCFHNTGTELYKGIQGLNKPALCLHFRRYIRRFLFRSWILCERNIAIIMAFGNLIYSLLSLVNTHLCKIDILPNSTKTGLSLVRKSLTSYSHTTPTIWTDNTNNSIIFDWIADIVTPKFVIVDFLCNFEEQLYLQLHRHSMMHNNSLLCIIDSRDSWSIKHFSYTKDSGT